MYCNEFVTLFTKKQEKACKQIRDLLINEQESASSDEIEHLCKEHDIHLKFSIQISSNRYEKLLPFVCGLKWFNQEIWDLLIDQGNYTQDELNGFVERAMINSKTDKTKKEKIFYWFIEHGINYITQENLHQRILHSFRKKHNFIIEYIDDNFDLSHVDDKNSDNFLTICMRELPKWAYQLDPFSKKYMFKQDSKLVLQNKDGNTVYHCVLLSILEILRNNNWYYGKSELKLDRLTRCFSNFDQTKYNAYKIDLFGLKNNKGETILDTACRVICDSLNLNLNGVNSSCKKRFYKDCPDLIKSFKIILTNFKYDFTTDNKKMYTLFQTTLQKASNY